MATPYRNFTHINDFPSTPLQTFGVNDSGLSSESQHVFRASCPESPLRIPPSTRLFDLLSERKLLDGKGNVDQVGILRRGNRGALLIG